MDLLVAYLMVVICIHQAKKKIFSEKYDDDDDDDDDDDNDEFYTPKRINTIRYPWLRKWRICWTKKKLKRRRTKNTNTWSNA